MGTGSDGTWYMEVIHEVKSTSVGNSSKVTVNITSDVTTYLDDGDWATSVHN